MTCMQDKFSGLSFTSHKIPDFIRDIKLVSFAISFTTLCNEEPSACDLENYMIKLCKCHGDLDLDPRVPNVELIQDMFMYYNKF